MNMISGYNMVTCLMSRRNAEKRFGLQYVVMVMLLPMEPSTLCASERSRKSGAASGSAKEFKHTNVAVVLVHRS